MLLAKVVVPVKASTCFCVQNEHLQIERQAITKQPVIACQYKLMAGTAQAQITDSTFVNSNKLSTNGTFSACPSSEGAGCELPAFACQIQVTE